MGNLHTCLDQSERDIWYRITNSFGRNIYILCNGGGQAIENIMVLLQRGII